MELNTSYPASNNLWNETSRLCTRDFSYTYSETPVKGHLPNKDNPKVLFQPPEMRIRLDGVHNRGVPLYRHCSSKIYA